MGIKKKKSNWVKKIKSAGKEVANWVRVPGASLI